MNFLIAEQLKPFEQQAAQEPKAEGFWDSQVGSLKAATKVKETIEARLKLGQDALPKEKPPVPTLEEYWKATFQPVYLESAVAASTAASYRHNFNTHILPAFGARRLNEIEHDRMEEFVSDLVKKKLAKATIQTITKELCKFFNHARKRKLVTDNPATGLSQLYSQAPTKHEKIEPLTHEEVPLFLASTDKHAPRCYALFFTAIHTGLRKGELVGSHTADI